jgi:hypothetical protein
MLLREMFSPIGAPAEEKSDIDWMGDLKFFIDNDDKLLTNVFFPAVKKHKEHKGNPSAFKLYIRPLEQCVEQYCTKFEIDEKENKFSKEGLIELAKKIAEEQEKHMSNGDYEDQ